MKNAADEKMRNQGEVGYGTVLEEKRADAREPCSWLKHDGPKGK